MPRLSHTGVDITNYFHYNPSRQVTIPAPFPATGTDRLNPKIFLTTPLTYAIVNLKPLSPGHVLVCPRRRSGVQRFTCLSGEEVADLFSVVQVVQRMLARSYFPEAPGSSG